MEMLSKLLLQENLTTNISLHNELKLVGDTIFYNLCFSIELVYFI